MFFTRPWSIVERRFPCRMKGKLSAGSIEREKREKHGEAVEAVEAVSRMGKVSRWLTIPKGRRDELLRSRTTS